MTFRFERKPYFKKPKRLLAKPRLTVAQIAAKVTNETRRKSMKVSILDFKEMRTPKVLEGWTVYRLVTRNNENEHRYRITIFSPTPKITKDTKLMIDDPNPLFVFKFEFALAKRGNAFIYRTNGDPPMTTNPRMVPGLSHHSLAALKFLIKKTVKYKNPAVKKK